MQQENFKILSQLYQVEGNTIEEIQTNFKIKQKQSLTQLYKYLQTEEDLDQLQLHGNVIGVDIEQTEDIGFDGQISLIQFKDDTDVYIVDVIEIGLESQKLKDSLTKIFTNQSFVKVFYAGNQDVQWLKRDFSIEIQNYFDIKEIADKCKLKGGSSLIYLWKQYCCHSVSKTYKNNMQTSDWAERPLTQEKLIYAAYDCYYLPYLRYVLLLEFSKLEIKEQVKMVEKFQKTIVKEYKKPVLSVQELAKIVEKEYNLYMQIVKEYNDQQPIYVHLQTQSNAAQLVKFIALEIMKVRQDHAVHHNDPAECLEENEEVILIAIKIYSKLNIQKIQSYSQYYVDLGDYENQQYKITKQYLKKIIEKDWEIYFQAFCKGLYQSFVFDINFIKFGLNYIYDALQTPESKNQQVQQKLEEKKLKQTEFAEKYTRKKPAYGNCKIYTKEDFFLCNCDEKKIRWYLKQNLADLISEDPPTIKLKFDPSGFKEDGKDKAEYITIERVNQCVICGKEDNLLKFHIVPVLYKKHIQGKRSYDVVCLCLTCHHKASSLNDSLKQQISEKYNVQIKSNTKDSLLEQIKGFIKSIEAFKKKNKNLPQEAQKKFSNQFTQQFSKIRNHEQFLQINQFDLNQIKFDEEGLLVIDEQFFKFYESLKNNSDKFSQVDDESNNDHGKLVVQQLKTEQDIDDFLVFWRDNFLNELKPQFLNEAWAIDHKFKRTFGEKSQFNPNNQLQQNETTQSEQEPCQQDNKEEA